MQKSVIKFIVYYFTLIHDEVFNSDCVLDEHLAGTIPMLIIDTNPALKDLLDAWGKSSSGPMFFGSLGGEPKMIEGHGKIRCFYCVRTREFSSLLGHEDLPRLMRNSIPQNVAQVLVHEIRHEIQFCFRNKPVLRKLSKIEKTNPLIFRWWHENYLPKMIKLGRSQEYIDGEEDAITTEILAQNLIQSSQSIEHCIQEISLLLRN